MTKEKDESDTYSVYLLECGDGSIYTGIAKDVERRLQKHMEGTGARYTAAKKAVRIIYTEVQPDRSAALRREAEIKKWPRERKLALGSGGTAFGILQT
jgi:putative endonuclease